MNPKQKKILEVSIDIFYNKGYTNTPIRDIIDASGFGTSTFYRYFQNKEDVLKQLLEEFLIELNDNINNQSTEGEDFYLYFIETIRIIIQTFIKNPQLSEIYSRVAGIGNLIDNLLKEFDNQFLQLSVKNIQYGIKKGVFQNIPVFPVAISSLATIKYVVYKWSVEKELSTEEMMDIVLSFHKSIVYGIVVK